MIYLEKFVKVKNTDPYCLNYWLTAKLKSWSYEKEWRLISTIPRKNKRIVGYPPELVKRIFIGHKLADEQRSVYDMVIEMFRDKHPNKPIYVVYPNSDKLKLNLRKFRLKVESS